jgi:hypothetical protein
MAVLAHDRSLPEWRFSFDLLGRDLTSSSLPELLLDSAGAWAEKSELAVGGGFTPLGAGDRIWRFDFGLCVTIENREIPESKAHELYSRLQRFAWKRGAMIRGGYRPFAKTESPPDDWVQQLARLLACEPVDWGAVKELFRM